MAVLPSPRTPSWNSDEAQEVIVDGLEKGSPRDSFDDAKRSVWKRVLVGDASQENQTKRAMQSRHLTMIGERFSSTHDFMRLADSPILKLSAGLLAPVFFSALAQCVLSFLHDILFPTLRVGSSAGGTR